MIYEKKRLEMCSRGNPWDPDRVARDADTAIRKRLHEPGGPVVRADQAEPQVGVVEGSLFRLEFDVSASRSIYDTLGRVEGCERDTFARSERSFRHFSVLMAFETLLARRLTCGKRRKHSESSGPCAQCLG